MQESGPFRISVVKLTTMKRFLLILSLLLCVQVTFAQRGRRDWKPQTEISLSYSAYPRMAAEEFRDGHYGEIFGGSFDSQRAQVDQIHSIGLITGEVAFKLKKWFTVGVQVAGTSFWADASVPGPGSRERRSICFRTYVSPTSVPTFSTCTPVSAPGS